MESLLSFFYTTCVLDFNNLIYLNTRGAIIWSKDFLQNVSILSMEGFRGRILLEIK